MNQGENDDENYSSEDQQIGRTDIGVEHDANGAPFWYVNKDSFPMSSKTWERMWDYVERVHPDGAKIACAIRNNSKLQKVSYSAMHYSAVTNFTYTAHVPRPANLESFSSQKC